VTLPVYAGGEETGMTYFFEGNYAAAVSLFESRVTQNNVSRATYFYLALSQTALVLAGQADRNVLAGARNYYVMADVAGAPDLTAALRYVSPRIRAELERQP
jgi:hypothetical protein